MYLYDFIDKICCEFDAMLGCCLQFGEAERWPLQVYLHKQENMLEKFRVFVQFIWYIQRYH